MENQPFRTTQPSHGTVSVEQKAFEDFKEYALRAHELCRYLLQLAMVVFYALPFVLLIFRTMTGTDKVVILLIWILFMFGLAIFLIFVSFFDKRLKQRSEELYNTPLDELGVIGPNSALHRELQEQLSALRNDSRNPDIMEESVTESAAEHCRDRSFLLTDLVAPQNLAGDRSPVVLASAASAQTAYTQTASVPVDESEVQI